MPETVTLHRRDHTTENIHGDPTDETTGSVDIPGVDVAPASSTDSAPDQQTVDSTTDLYLPAGSPVPSAGDAMTIRGVEGWEVIGDPGVWPDGIEVHLRRAR